MKSLSVSILKQLYYCGPQSIAELSNAIGKSVPNITNRIQSLAKDRIVLSQGPGPSTGGRRAIHYSLNTSFLPHILTIGIDQYRTTVGLFDLSNTPLKESLEEDISLNTDSDALSKIIALVDGYLLDQDASNILAVGITMPGFVDSESGINSSYPDDHPLYDIRAVVQRHLGIPAYLENDSTAIAIAEHKFGKAKGSDNMLVINLNWGVGLGMIIEGKLFKGHSGFAGEFSHIPLAMSNKLCSCGKRGCLEVEASLIAAIEYAEEKLEAGDSSQMSEKYHLHKHIGIDDLMDAALNGDQIAIESFSRIGYILGKGIATLIHIINPEKIIISGRGAKIGQILMHRIQSSILEFCIQRLSKETTIEISELSNAQMLGTATVAVSSLDWTTLAKNKREELNTINQN